MKRTTAFLLLLLSLLPFAANAQQDFIGYTATNYAGVNGIDLNPASIADSRFKVDIMLTGASFGLSNNYIGLRKTAFDNRVGPLLPPDSTSAFPNFEDSLFTDRYLFRRTGNYNKSVYFSNRVHLPSFMITLDEKNALAFTGSIRTYLNVDGVGEPLAELAYSGLENSQNWLQRIENKQLSIQYMTWAEFGVTWGHTLVDQKQHFMKIGVRPKLLLGLGSAYFFADNLQYLVQNDSTLTFFRSEIRYSHSDNFEFPDGQRPNYRLNFNSPGIGLDLGFVYEWRPDYQKYKYDMDGETDLWMRHKNKYKLRVGASLTDLGSIKFQKGEFANDFIADVNSWNVNNLEFDSIPIRAFDDTLRNRFGIGTTTNSAGDYRMNLPLAFSFQIDYNIWKDFYVNLTPFYAFQFRKNAEKVHELSRITLSPRWDHKWFGVWVPMMFDQHRNFNIGTGVKIGPLIMGTTNLSPFFIKKGQHGDKILYGADFYMAIKIPIHYKAVRDRDKDKVSDKKDKCVEVPGVWEFLGCPDRDGDHVQDSEDICPDEPGLKQLNGCPDKDGDGITDKQDACPEEAGPQEFNGCPDKDGDKIIDKEDDCPEEAGLPEFKGCPDKDGDGVMDKLDLCPEKAGPVDNEGCPEVRLHLVNIAGQSMNSVRQAKDGSFTFESLPADSVCVFRLDGENTQGTNDVRVIVNGNSKRAIRSLSDGLFRFDIPKPLKNTLKPMEVPDVVVQLTQQEAEILKKAFDNLEFESGKDIIRATSYASLDELAELLKKKPNWKLKISGHTDNVGKPAGNLKLSEKRAKAVKAYLMKKGVSESQLKTEWFGQTRPIAPNTTPEGRQRNRRVEMLIIE
jgi:outer membrane protein OmpA-like peptidoglycan-associated protein